MSNGNTKNSKDLEIASTNSSFLARTADQLRSMRTSPTATYAGGAASAGAIVGAVLLGPIGAALGGALGGGIGGYLGSQSERNAATKRNV